MDDFMYPTAPPTARDVTMRHPTTRSLSTVTDHGITKDVNTKQNYYEPTQFSGHVELYYAHTHAHGNALTERALPNSENIKAHGYGQQKCDRTSHQDSQISHAAEDNDFENMPHRKRSRDELEDGEILDQPPVTKGSRQSLLHTPRQFEQTEVYSLSGTDSHAVAATKTYLESLACSYAVPMELLPDSSRDKRAALTTIYTTGVGIVMAVEAKQCSNMPVLPLPRYQHSGQVQQSPKSSRFMGRCWKTSGTRSLRIPSTITRGSYAK